MSKNDTAFVIGNGVSRSDIDISLISFKGTTYGCNALYREYAPDFLIAVDTKMILEISEAGYQNDHQVWTNPNRAYSRINNLNFFNPSKGWSSGPTALYLASKHNYKRIYILGFDYKGVNGLVNNIYAGTKNYKGASSKATYYGNWLRQTATVIKQNPDIQYIRVIEDGGFIPDELKILQNLKHCSVGGFKRIFENIENDPF